MRLEPATLGLPDEHSTTDLPRLITNGASKEVYLCHVRLLQNNLKCRLSMYSPTVQRGVFVYKYRLDDKSVNKPIFKLT